MTMDNGMDVQPGWQDLRDERDDYKACAENWEANATKWSDDWHELREERDALAARVQRLRDVIQVVCEQACGRIPEAAADALEEVWREPGEASLSRIKAQWQAEALAKVRANHRSGVEIPRGALIEAEKDYRRQAGEVSDEY